MGDLFIILPIAAAAAFITVPPLYKNKQKKEIFLYFAFLSIGIGMLVLMAFGVDIPSPSKVIVLIFKPITDWIMKFFM